MRQRIEFHAADHYHGDKSDEEHQTSHQTEEMHRLLAELIEEPKRHEIQITVHKTVETELRGTELTLTMLHHFLSDLRKACILSQIRDIAVHLREDLDILHHLIPISLQTAVHVVQLNARNLPCRGIEELGRQILRQGIIIAFLLPSAHEVVALLLNHAIELRYLVWTILQISVHRDDYIAFRRLESAIQSCGFTIITTETDTTNDSVFIGEL